MDLDELALTTDEIAFMQESAGEIDAWLAQIWRAAFDRNPQDAGIAVADFAVYMFLKGREYERNHT